VIGSWTLDQDLDVDPHFELDGDVEVDPIVDVDFDPRSTIARRAFRDRDREGRRARSRMESTSTWPSRSMSWVNVNVDVNLHVVGRRSRLSRFCSRTDLGNRRQPIDASAVRSQRLRESSSEVRWL